MVLNLLNFLLECLIVIFIYKKLLFVCIILILILYLLDSKDDFSLVKCL